VVRSNLAKFLNMIKKIGLIFFIGAVILTGGIFLTPLGRGLIESNPVTAISSAKNFPSDYPASKSQTPIGAHTQTSKSLSGIQNSDAGGIAPLATLESSRAERWRQVKKATSLEQQFIKLLNDRDVESPRFAMYLNNICSTSKNRQSQGPITREELKAYTKVSGSEMSEESITNSFTLSDKFSSRCSELGSIPNMVKAIEAVKKARASGSVLSLAPYLSIENEEQLTALGKVLENPELASVWLAQRRLLFMGVAENEGYFEGLNSNEKIAVLWTVICNFGADCADDGITRLDACLSSYLCGGNSVAESITDAVGKDKVPIIAARANKLSLDLAAAGADFFKPRQK
jgi:hypothetical protein